MRCVNEGTRSLPVDFQIFHGMVCNALSILEKNVETLGCCAIQGACRSIQMGHFQESLKYHPSFFCHTCFFFHPSLSPSARKLRELQQNVIQREHIRRLQGPAGGGQQKTGGGGRVEVPPGARVGLVKPGEKLGCVMHLLYLCRYGKMMFFFVDFLG